MVDFGNVLGKLIDPIFSFGGTVLKFVVCVPLFLCIIALVYFFVKYSFSPLNLKPDEMRKPFIKNKWYDLLRWLIIDFLERDLHRGEFKEYGFTFYVGRQGTGKTISMVRYLEVMKAKYPNCIIATNFSYYMADYFMNDWHDIMTIRNGTDGVIFAIDEIQSEYSAASWKDVPESLLSEISQQRKQRVKIVATSQFFPRVAKPLREQAATVVACLTYAGRLTRNIEYDALQYDSVSNFSATISKKIKALRKSSFVQSDAIRACYDTYEKIERMKKIEFIPRDKRGNNN